jgi:hypothetical protein
LLYSFFITPTPLRFFPFLKANENKQNGQNQSKLKKKYCAPRRISKGKAAANN